LLDWQDLFPGILEQGRFFMDAGPEVYKDALLRRRDGTDLKCLVALKGTSEGGFGSFVILVRRSDAIQTPSADDGLLKRLLNLPSAAAEDIAREVSDAATADHVVSLCRRTPELVRAMLESGASPVAIANMISSITDSATIRFIELAQVDLGPAPAVFAFVALGSQGRMEQTLFTDQDNAIVYDPGVRGGDMRVERYFSALAVSVCENLTKSGYRNCKGLVMANNPKWCQPLDVWKDYFKTWIVKAEEHEMMEFGTFFDLRCVKGDEGLIQILRTHIREEMAQASWFITQAAKNALLFKSPLRFFGNIVSAGSAKDKAGHLDLKTVMMPIVSFARLYSLQKDVVFTSTQERLSALSDKGVILPSQYHDIVTAFETLLRLRLRHQSVTIQKGGEPDNLIDPSWLGHIDEAVLKECFKEIDRIQERISRDFLGGETGI
jgi:CBS domain-containing protein